MGDKCEMKGTTKLCEISGHRDLILTEGDSISSEYREQIEFKYRKRRQHSRKRN